MLVAQISDLHVVEPGALAYGRVDTGRALEQAVDALNRLSPQPDLVIGSGDLVQSGAPAEYARLRSILSGLRAPFAPAVGNHDARPAFRGAFAKPGSSLETAPFVQYEIDLGALRVVVLDTLTPGSEAASFCDARAAWLTATLDASWTPALIVAHHPPFMTHVPWMDPPSLDWAARLGAVIRPRADGVAGIISGHIHRAIHTRVFGVSASSCPSTAHQVAFDFGAKTPLLSNETPGFQLHRWDGATLTTYTASLAGVFDTFSPSSPHHD